MDNENLTPSNRFLTNDLLSEEIVSNDHFLRPKDLNEYIGQSKIVQNIQIMIKSAKLRKSPMDHILFSGPPGLGKTSLAMIISEALGSNLQVISGPAIEKKGDLAATLTNLSPGDILFIDEIHRLNISIEEILYSAMEDFRLDIIIGQGASARTMKIDLPPFTLVGATTKSGLLSHPLRDRFMAQFHFEYYDVNDLIKIVQLNSQKMALTFSDLAKIKMAERARGTPRIVNRILRRVRDFALVKGKTLITEEEVEEALTMLGIDSLGLDSMDRKILEVIKEFYGGGPIGIDALCATLNEDKQTILDVYEPFLLKIGLLLRTPRGRMVSQKGEEYLKQEGGPGVSKIK